MKKRAIAIVALVAFVVLLGGAGVLLVDKEANANLAMTELHVSNLSCGSCVANIQSALDALSGVALVDVSLTSGISQVTFDPQQTDGQRIATVITEAGYPARVLRQLSADQFQKLQTEDSQLAQIYVAKVGKVLLPRDQFDAQVARLVSTTKQPMTPQQAALQVWNNLLQRTLILADAEQNQVIVQDGEVQIRVERLRQNIKDYKGFVQAGFGSEEAFIQKIKEDMTINRHLTQNIFAGVEDPLQRQAAFGRWYQQQISANPVVFFDTALKQATRPAGGCSSGGCCSKS